MAFVERKEPTLFKFERPGEMVEGILAGIEKVTIEGKPAVDFFIAVKDGKKLKGMFKVHATRDMLTKVVGSDVGFPIKIKFVGDDEKVKTNGRPMRRFSVQLDKDGEADTSVIMETSLADSFAE